MTVPNAFANLIGTIALSKLDSNFNTPITIGNTSVQLGNTITTINDITLANVTITSGTSNVTNVNVTNINVTNLTATLANITTLNVASEYVTASNVATANIGNLTLSNALTVPNGGTGRVTLPVNNVLLGNGTGSIASVAPGNAGNVLTSVGGVWVSNSAVTTSAGGLTTQVQFNSGGSFAGSANLTFNGTTLTANTLNLANALGTIYGGTGLSSFTSNGVVYASSSSVLATGAALTFDGTGLSAGQFVPTSTTAPALGIYQRVSGQIVITAASAPKFAADATDVALNAAGTPNINGNPTSNAMSIGGSGWYCSMTGANNYWNHSYNGTVYNLRYQGSAAGSIVVNSASVAYNTTSDYRLKENVQPMTGALARVALLKPCTYRWKATGEAAEGFIAHELQEVIPSAVTGAKDAMEDDGLIKAQGVDTSFIVATLTAAIQELTARVAQLESK